MVALFAAGVAVSGAGGVLSLRASVIGSSTAQGKVLTIDVLRWSTDADLAPMLAAFSPPAPAAAPPAPVAPADGRGGRGGRGGGRGAAAPPASPLAQLTAAVKAAPTVGYIWSDGPTGYAIRYAWRSASAGAGQRIVLITDRRLGAGQPLWPAAPAPDDSEFTVIEMRLDGKGHGEAKTSAAARVVVDSAAKTLALDGYAAAPAQLEVTQ